MTDRLKGLTVVLDKDYREDDAEAIINAIKMVKGVQDVQTHVADLDHYMASSRAARDLGDRVIDLVQQDRREQLVRRTQPRG